MNPAGGGVPVGVQGPPNGAIVASRRPGAPPPAAPRCQSRPARPRSCLEAAADSDDVRAAGHLARELESGPDRVRPAWTRELQLVLEPTRAKNDLVEGLDELALGARRHVESMCDSVNQQVLRQIMLQDWVVPVIQRSGAREAVEVFAAGLITSQLPSARRKTHGKHRE